MSEVVLPKGSIVTFDGLPCGLVEDTKVICETLAQRGVPVTNEKDRSSEVGIPKPVEVAASVSAQA